MLTVVLVGSSNTRLARLGEGPRMFTPRGYARRIDGDLKDVGNRHIEDGVVNDTSSKTKIMGGAA